MTRRGVYRMRHDTRPDTGTDIDWRIRSRKASEQAYADMCARYPIITPENASIANDYREVRFMQIMSEV